MTSPAVILPLLNPIRIFQVGDPNEDYFAKSIPYFEAQVDYYQKFNNSDTLCFQFGLPKNDLRAPIIQIINSEEIVVATLTFETLTLSFSPLFNWYQVKKELSSFEEGAYYVKMTVYRSVSKTYTLKSEWFCIQEEHDNTILLTYTHDENDFDIIFRQDEQSSATTFQLRVEGGFPSNGFAPGSKDVMYDNQELDTVLLSSTPFLVKKITFGDSLGIPNYLADTINRIWSCSNVQVDGKDYVKTTGAKFEPTRSDKFPLGAWKLEIIDVDNSYSYGSGTFVSGGIGVMIITDDFEVGALIP